MLFGFKKSLQQCDFFNGFTDFHCHLLPGVDDGVKTMDESLELLKYYESLGIRKVWFTPHIMEDIPNTTTGLQQRFSELKSNYKGGIQLHLAAEYMMDQLFQERMAVKDFLPLGEAENHLLVETSYYNPPMHLHETLLKIKSSGFYPVLAHPERYQYMDDQDYKKLKEMGIKFQLNLPSLAGMYGEIVQKKAERLLKKGYYNLMGTDTHRINQITFCANTKIKEKDIKRILTLKESF